MEEFYGLWRRRFSVHAALLLTLSIAIGLRYFATLGTDDRPEDLAKLLGIQAVGEPRRTN